VRDVSVQYVFRVQRILLCRLGFVAGSLIKRLCIVKSTEFHSYLLCAMSYATYTGTLKFCGNLGAVPKWWAPKGLHEAISMLSTHRF
jgi:hypothetical protein